MKPMDRVCLVLLALGLWLFLSALPKAQPPAEGSLGAYPLPPVVGMTGGSQSFTLTVKKHDTYDPRWIQFYELRFQDGSAVTISGDIDVPFIQTLLKAQGKQRLTLEAFTLSEVSR